jgi:hypothetical protein
MDKLLYVKNNLCIDKNNEDEDEDFDSEDEEQLDNSLEDELEDEDSLEDSLEDENKNNNEKNNNGLEYNNSFKVYENITNILINKKIKETDDKIKKNKKNNQEIDQNNLNSGDHIKKGPGRPRKTPKKEPSQRKGIALNPFSADHHIEFLYDQPIIFKKLSQFFKLMASQTLQIVFRKNDIIIYTSDHHQKSKIRVRIDTTKLNHYYIKEITDIGLLTKYLELLFNKVDKDYSDLLILSNIGETQKSLNLVFNNDMQVNENHTIDLIGIYNKMENENEFIDENYTIKLDMPGKYFKKIINDIKFMSNEISIYQNTVDSPLVMGYINADRKIRSEHFIKSNAKIKLKSYLHENKSFRANLKIDYIKPISSSQLSENIQWFLDENKGSMIKAIIDNGTIEIKIKTEIIDERNDTLED